MASLQPQCLTFSVSGPIVRHDLTGLCARIGGLLRASDADVALCDVTGIAPDGVPPDAVTVDALARLQLAARRSAVTVRLRNASPELCASSRSWASRTSCPE